MTVGENDHRPEIPENWDVLADLERDAAALPEETDSAPLPLERRGPLPTVNLAASFWADGVTVLAIVTATLLWLSASGHQLVISVVPWAAVLGLMWWLFAAAVLVTVRQGTPGMLLAGIQFDEQLAPGRLVAVLAVAALGALLLGLPAFLGAAHSPLALAGGRPLEAGPVE